jgi:hypothetical protein
VLSDDGVYRYLLERWWGPSERAATFIMLNPSTADATVDDRTIGRCSTFARTWGLDGLRVANLYALRSSDPGALRSHPDPVGPDNDSWLALVLDEARAHQAPVIVAWGAHARPDRASALCDLAAGLELLTLGLTVAGAPKHPLYLRADTIPVRYTPQRT